MDVKGTANMDATSMDSSTEGRYLLDRRCDIASTRKPEIVTLSIGRRCVILFVCLTLVLISGGVSYGLGVALPELVRIYEAPRTQAAMVQSLFFGITIGLGGIFWTIPISRLGEGLCVVVGGVMAALGLLISSAATSLSIIIVCTGIFSSAGMGCSYIVPFFVVQEVFQSSSSVILLTVGTSVGQIVLPFIFEYTISDFGLSGSLLIVSALALNTVPCGLVIHYTMRRYRQQSVENPTKESSNFNENGPKQLWQSFKAIFHDKCVCLFLMSCFLWSFTGNFESWFIVDLLTLRGHERAEGSLIVSMLGVANILSRILAGFLRIKMKIPTIYHWIYVTVLLALSHVLVLVLRDYWTVFASCMLFGVTVGMLVSQTPAILLEIAGEDGYRAGWPVVGVVYGVGDILAGLVTGILKDVTGSYDVVLLTACGCSLLMTLITVGIIIISNNTSRQKRSVEEYTLLK